MVLRMTVLFILTVSLLALTKILVLMDRFWVWESVICGKVLTEGTNIMSSNPTHVVLLHLPYVIGKPRKVY